MSGRKKRAAKGKEAWWAFVHLVLAGIVYLAFAVYLYSPHFRRIRDLDNLVVVVLPLAAFGCYVLSRRWVSLFTGSLAAGALYGFGPYVLGLLEYHVAASLLAALIPWLFLPSAFAFKRRFTWLRWPCAILPFAAIFSFFEVCGRIRFFAVPKQARLHADGLIGLLAPLVAAKLGSVGVLIGFYHVPIAAFAIGLAMSVAAKRYAVLTVPIAGLVLGLSRPVLGVSPVMWFTIPAVFFAVAAGVGVQGISIAGARDKKWLLLAASLMAALAIFALLLATKYFQVFLGLAFGYAKLFLEAGKIYSLGAVVIGIIFVITRLKFRASILRQGLLVAVLGLDIFIGARFIIDKML